MVTTAASNPRVTEAGDFVFMASVTDAFQGRVMAQFARDDLEVDTVALLTLRDDVYTEGITEFFAANFTQLGGTVVADTLYDDGTTDFTDLLARIADQRPDALFVSAFIPELPVIVRQAAEALPARRRGGADAAARHGYVGQRNPAGRGGRRPGGQLFHHPLLAGHP